MDWMAVHTADEAADKIPKLAKICKELEEYEKVPKSSVEEFWTQTKNYCDELLRDVEELSYDMNENTKDLEEIRKKKAELLATV